MKMRQAILLLFILIAGVCAFFIKGYMDKNVVVLKSGSVITVDETWEDSGLVYYQIDNEVNFFRSFKVESYGKPDLNSSLRHLKFKLSRIFAKTNSEFKHFASETSASIRQNTIWVVGILSVTTFSILLLLVFHLVMRRQPIRESVTRVQETQVKVLEEDVPVGAESTGERYKMVGHCIAVSANTDANYNVSFPYLLRSTPN